MVTGCVIRKCSSVWSPISYTSYHCFPLKNQELMAKWMLAIPPGYISIPKQSSRICSRHFLNECFSYSENGKRSLKKDAVPTLFGPEAKKEDTLNSVIIDVKTEEEISHYTDEKHVYRYVKKSKYLQTKKQNATLSRTVSNIPVQKSSKSTSKIIIQMRKPKITNEEIELKKQIIMLKKRLLRRETRIKSIMTAMNAQKIENS